MSRPRRAERRICGLCGRAFGLVKPNDEETERDKLRSECAKLPPPPRESGESAGA